MVGSSTGVFEFNSVVRGHHVYKTVWTSAIDECYKWCRKK